MDKVMVKVKIYLVLTIIISAGNAISNAGELIKTDYRQYEKDAPVVLEFQKGHTGMVSSIAFSPDGKYIATGSDDKLIKLWTADGILVKTIHTFFMSGAEVSSGIVAITFSPDGKYIAAGATYGLGIWTIDGKLVKEYDDVRASDGITFSPDGNIIVIRNPFTVEFMTFDGRLIRSFPAPDVVISPDWKQVLVIDENETINLWSVKGKSITRIEGPGNIFQVDNPALSGETFSGADYSPDGKYIITVTSPDSKTEPGKIHLWSRDGKLITSFKNDITIASVTFSPDSRFIVSQSNDGKTVRIWTTDGKIVNTFNDCLKKNIISPDGKFIISYLGGITLKLRDINSRYEKVFDNSMAFAFSPDNKYLAIGSKNTIILSKNDGNPVKIFGEGSSIDGIHKVLFSPDGKYLASGSSDNTVRLWTGSGEEVKIFEGHSNPVIQVAFSADGKYIFSESWDHTDRLWTTEGKLIKTMKSCDGINCMIYSPKGKYRAFQSEDTIQIMTMDGNPVKTFKNQGKIACFSPDEKFIVLISDNTTQILSIEGEPVKTFKNRGRICCFSPDGKFIAEIPYNNNRVINLLSTDGTLVRSLSCGGDSDYISEIIFSPDGKYIATINARSSRIYLWTIDGKPVHTFTGHTDYVSSINFSPDGKFIASGSLDGTIRLWNITTNHFISLSAFASHEWFVFHENGYFDCSSGGRKYIAFIRGITAYNPEQFWDRFYTPGLIEKFIAGEKLPEKNINDVIQDIPVVNILSPENGYKTENDKVTVRVSAKSANGTGKILLYHNGRIIDENSRGIILKSAGTIREFTVELADGENVFAGAASDKAGLVEGRSDKIVITYVPAKIVKPDMYILSVGVSEYKDSNIRLKSPDMDAVTVSETLKETAGSIYGGVYISLLVNGNATKEKIKKAVDAIGNKARKIDTVIIFFAGHGDMDSNIYYYLPYDADITDISSTGVSISDLSSYIQALQANKVALFLDTCKSGGAVKELARIALSRGYEEKKLIAGLAKNRGIAVFSASNESQSAYEIKDLNHGIFTWCLIDALKNRKNEISINSLITINKLLSVVNQMTRETAEKYLEVEQSPILYMFGDDFIIGK